MFSPYLCLEHFSGMYFMGWFVFICSLIAVQENAFLEAKQF